MYFRCIALKLYFQTNVFAHFCASSGFKNSKLSVQNDQRSEKVSYTSFFQIL